MVNFLNLILMVLILFLLLIMSIEILSGTLILIKLMEGTIIANVVANAQGNEGTKIYKH